ncbi:MAG: hypothetical protein ACYDAK_10010 [Candidatus Limnocylindrales bacterium]
MIGPQGCSRHRAALEAFVERREIDRSTGAALAHLATCRRCDAELVAFALTATALRRLAADAAAGSRSRPSIAAGDPLFGWPELRARIERGREPRWRWRSQVGGAIVAIGLVAALIGPPSILSVAQPALDEAGAVPVASADAGRHDAAAEAAWIRQNIRAGKEAAIDGAAPAPRPNAAVFGPEARPLPPPAPIGPVAR